MNIEDIVRYCVAVKTEIEAALKARAWFSYSQETDKVQFNMIFPAINYRSWIVVDDISDKMHTGTSSKAVAKDVVDIVISILLGKVKQ